MRADDNRNVMRWCAPGKTGSCGSGCGADRAVARRCSRHRESAFRKEGGAAQGGVYSCESVSSPVVVKVPVRFSVRWRVRGCVFSANGVPDLPVAFVISGFEFFSDFGFPGEEIFQDSEAHISLVVVHENALDTNDSIYK